MPPISPQSSRGGLITAVVIFVILFVTAAIFAIYYGVNSAKVQDDYTTLKNSVIPNVLPSGALTGPELSQLEAARSASNRLPDINQSMPLLKVAMQQRDDLKNLIDPNAPSAEQAYADAKAAMQAGAAQIAKAGSTAPSTIALLDSYNAMARALLLKQEQINGLQRELASARQATQAKVDELNAAVHATHNQVTEIQNTENKAIAAAESARSENNKTVAEIEADRQKERQDAAATINKLNSELAAKTNDLDNMNRELAKIRQRLAAGRVSVNQPLIQAADGTIIRVPSPDIVYISRGSSDQIIPGMTFEVYDRNAGVPAVDTVNPNSDSLPVGKASIEVISVDPHTSECRVTRHSVGSNSIQEGDLIVNLVYDPHVKYNFVVYGKFDLNHDGVATDQETEVIKQKILEWGGHLENKVNVDTDFLVIGVEPVVPKLTEAERRDPIALQRASAAQAEYDAYQATIKRAQDLHVPILNQNRFLYLIGSYSTISQ
ncbi:MAG TPA: hypothetical protein VG722_01325 [Tepidisphaeraceae bacterium]|nr:hypothetical protein [Tepidisphaeraceae bacterium]